jgi:ribosomal protein S27AE
MINLKLQSCPFCGGSVTYNGSQSIICECGASVFLSKHDGDLRSIVEKWNTRSTNLEPLINIVAKIPSQGSAYTDLCSANFKLKQDRSKKL